MKTIPVSLGELRMEISCPLSLGQAKIILPALARVYRVIRPVLPQGQVGQIPADGLMEVITEEVIEDMCLIVSAAFSKKGSPFTLDQVRELNVPVEKLFNTIMVVAMATRGEVEAPSSTGEPPAA